MVSTVMLLLHIPLFILACYIVGISRRLTKVSRISVSTQVITTRGMEIDPA